MQICGFRYSRQSVLSVDVAFPDIACGGCCVSSKCSCFVVFIVVVILVLDALRRCINCVVLFVLRVALLWLWMMLWYIVLRLL